MQATLPTWCCTRPQRKPLQLAAWWVQHVGEFSQEAQTPLLHLNNLWNHSVLRELLTKTRQAGRQWWESCVLNGGQQLGLRTVFTSETSRPPFHVSGMQMWRTSLSVAPSVPELALGWAVQKPCMCWLPVNLLRGGQETEMRTPAHVGTELQVLRWQGTATNSSFYTNPGVSHLSSICTEAAIKPHQGPSQLLAAG